MGADAQHRRPSLNLKIFVILRVLRVFVFKVNFMAWSAQQITLAHIATQACGWNRAHYQLLLVNVAGIRPVGGKVSSKNPTADNAGFERFMAYAESQGFIDAKHGEGYWNKCAHQQCLRIHRKIEAVAGQAVAMNLVNSPDFLPKFIERQTQQREPTPTSNLEECDVTWSVRILEGLKAWLFPIARQRGLRLEI